MFKLIDTKLWQFQSPRGPSLIYTFFQNNQVIILFFLYELVQCKPHPEEFERRRYSTLSAFCIREMKSIRRGPNSLRANQPPGPLNRYVFHRRSHMVRAVYTPTTIKKRPVHTRIRTRTLRPTYGRVEACTAPCRPHARGGSHEPGPMGERRARATAAMRPRVHVARIQRLPLPA